MIVASPQLKKIQNGGMNDHFVFRQFFTTRSFHNKKAQPLSFMGDLQLPNVYIEIRVFPKTGGKPPKWMVKIMENPIF